MDISNLTSVATSTPEQAAANIDNASTFSLAPTGDKAFNSVLAPQAEQAAKPTDASPSVHEQMSQSTEHTALLTPDVPHLNFIDETIKRMGDFVHGRQNIDEQISSLALKRMQDPSKFSDEDEGALDRLNQERQVSQGYNANQPPKSLEPFSNIAEWVNGPEVADHIADFLGGIGDAVAKAGTPTGRVISKSGPLGSGLALAYGLGKSAYDHLAGTTYNELSNQVDANGEPTNMDETSKKHIAMGVGIVGAALQTLPLAMGAPGLGSATSVTENAVLRSAVTNIAKQALVFGGVNALTEATRIVGEEVGKSYDGTHASLVDGVVAASNKMVNGVEVEKADGTISQQYPYAERVGRAFGSGAALGGILGLGGEVIGAASRGAGAASPEAGVPNPDTGPQAPIEPPTPIRSVPKSQIEQLRDFAKRPDSALTPNEIRFRDEQVKPQLEAHDAAARATEQNQIDTANKRIELRQGHLAEKTSAIEAIVKKYPEGTTPDKFTSEDATAYKTAVREQAEAKADIQKFQDQANAATRSQAANESIRQGNPPPITTAVQQSMKVLQFKQAMLEVNAAAEKTGVSKLAPGQLTDLTQKAFERSGLKKIFTTLGQLRDKLPFADVERLIAPVKETLQGQEHTPFEIDTHTAAEIGRDNPKMWDATSVEPNGPNPKQAEAKLKSVATAIKERSDILEKLGLKSEDVQAPPESNVVKGEFGKAKPSEPFDLEAQVRRADEILKKIQIYKGQVKEWNAGSENVEDILRRPKIDIASPIPELQAELDAIKQKVADHYKMNPPGDLLFGNWDEPDLEDVRKAGSEHVNAMTFTEAIQKALPKAEVQKINIAQQNARKATVDSIREAAQHEMIQVQDLQVGFTKDARLEEEQVRIVDDPNYKIVEKFRAAGKAARKAKEISIYQIDPRFLTNDQIKKYADDPRLKEHGVFKKGGSKPDDVAQALGVVDGDTVLKILSSTPTREQVNQARAAANAVHDEQKARASVDLNHVHIIRAINDQASNNIEEMRFMLDHEWPATKQGIKRIALPLPRIEELDAKADEIIRKTKLSELDPRKFEVGANRNLRLAVKAILKNEIYAAFQFKEAEALNRLLEKKARIAVGFSNRDKKFVRKLYRKEERQVIKDAGPLISNAVNEILAVWNLKPTKAQGAPPDAPPTTGDFNKWVKTTNKAGLGDFSVPEDLSDIRQHVDDMTYEQFRVIVDRLRVLHRQAEIENRIKVADKKLTEQEETEDLHLWAKGFVNHVDDTHGTGGDYEPPVQDTIESGFEKAKGYVADVGQQLAAKQNVWREVDRGETSGRAYLELDAAMEGSGEHYEKSGFTYVKKLNKWISASIEKANEVHGDVDSLEKKLIYIPEFEGIRELNHGPNHKKKGLTKGSLLCALANMGQKYTKALMFKNTGGVSDQLWQTVFDKYLEPKDVIYMQTIVNLYKSPVLRDKTRELQEKQGREVTFVEGVPFYHRGVKYPGGYIRVRTVHKYDDAEMKRAQDFFEGKGASYFNEKEGDKWSVQYASQTTDQGYLISRKGNKEPIDLDFSGIFTGLFEIAHDHAYREPLADFFKKMRAPGVKSALIRAVGLRKVDTLIGTNLEIAGRPSANEMGYFKHANNVIKRTLMRFGSGFSVAVIWGNMTAVCKQIEALPEMFNALGPKSVVHGLHVNYLMMTNPEKIPSMIRLASRIDPNLAKYIDNVSDETLNILSELVPRKGRKTKKSTSIHGVKEASRGGVSSLVNYGYSMARVGGFAPHQWADTYTKVLQVFTVIKHVMAGDHPNYPKEKVDKMTEKEQFEAIQHVVAQLSTLTQIQSRHDLKAPIQKNLAMNWATFFWNYPRNIINNTVLDTRRAIWETKDGMEKWKSAFDKRKAGAGGGGSGGSGGGDGGGGSGNDFGDGARSFGRAANVVMSHLVWRTIGAMIGLWAAGKAIKIFDDIKDIDWKDIKSVEDGGMAVLGEMLQMNFEHSMVAPVPVVNSIKYALDTKRKYGMAEVRDPITQGLSSVATCWPAIKNILTLSKDPDRMQMRACLESESYLGLPVPVRGILKTVQYYNDHSVGNVPDGFHAQFTTAMVDDMHKDLKGFVADPGKAPDHLVASADALAKQLIPDAVKVPDGARDAIKMAVSHGQPGADGLYGFSKNDWEKIMRSAPELGLTSNGRNAQDSTQQEKAMGWSLHDDAVHLEEKDLPVNTHTLYGAHVLGVQVYEKLFNAPADTKVKAVLGDALKSHPELANFKTIGQVKSYLNERVDKGRESAQGDNKLTLKTSNNED